MERIGSYDGDRTYRASYAQPVPMRAPARVGQLVGWAGALVSLGLLVGMVVWAFQLATRDVSDVPVIRALDGPMRAAPADPGGTQAAHQGLAVNRLAEGAEAGQVPDRLVLAPPPVDLAAIDLGSSSVSVEPAPESVEPVTAEPHELIQRLIERNQGADLDAINPPAEASVAVPEVLPAPPPAAVAADLIPASVAGLAQSLRPMLRPGTPAARAPAVTEAHASRAAQIDPASLAEGTRLVQLGAFDTPEIAKAEWDRLTTRFPDYFNGRAQVLQEASSGGSAFYRLRAHGFEDLAASRRFCAALTAQNAPCIPVTVR